ncbi:hypothetical protein [Streptomyces hokutonensis]|uniref:hypothetical protein n=1 Tax=Streptomyces hokutonensis TaxID=1306990 RepID=UPI00036AB023|nr:hypothetical protein [Streptomyces hokutonensis]
MSPAIPVRCLARPLAGGLVVPYVSLIHNGHAVFGSLDADRARRAFLQRLCQICAQPLQEQFFVIVRPADQEQGYSPEPALHPECQPYTAANCPMLNGTATHPAGRPCTDPSCPCPEQTPDQGHSARSGRPAERYEAWMIAARHYRVVFREDASDVPAGISLDVPVLRKRVLRDAVLPAEHATLLALVRAALGLEQP